ncbi:MAG: phosphomethylpyrimidine kinase, partial [Campylobacter concisus]|nr:phosphomethylpyrimidine kinase [Campylobacter concisus]
MKSYILNLEKEFSLIENGFKEQERRALADYKAKGAEHCKELALLAYSSEVYQ